MTDEANRSQVLVLRELGPLPFTRDGAVPGCECPLLRLTRLAIEQRLAGPQALPGRRRTETWQATVRVDPDRIEVCLPASLTGTAVQVQDWANLDQMACEAGE